MAIAFDAASNSGYQSPQSSYSWSHTCSGDNLFLAVDVSLLSVPGTTVVSITYGGISLTLIGARSTVSGAGRIECWGLVNPPEGTKTITVTLSASIASASCAVSYRNVSPFDAFESFGSNQATNVGAADATVTIITVGDNDWVHAALASDDISVTANQTSRNNVTGLLGSGANEDNNAPKTPPGSVAMSYTAIGSGQTWVIAAYAIRPTSDPAPPGGPAPKPVRSRIRAPLILGGFGPALPQVGPLPPDYVHQDAAHVLVNRQSQGWAQILQRTGGPLLPKTGPHPVVYAHQDASHTHLDRRAQGQAQVLQRQGGPLLPKTGPHALLYAHQDASVALVNWVSAGYALTEGGVPSPPARVGPRAVLHAAPPDESAQVRGPSSQGTTMVLGGEANAPATPPTLRNVFLAFTEDPTPLVRWPPSSVLWATPLAARVPPKVVLSYADDTLSRAPPPSGVVMGGRPSRPVTPPTLRTPTAVPAEDTLSHQRWPPAVMLVGALSGVVPALRPPLARPTVHAVEDTISASVPPTGAVLGGRASGAVTPPTPRVPLVVPAEDVLSRDRWPPAVTAPFVGPAVAPAAPVRHAFTEDTLSGGPPPSGAVTGGRPPLAAAPPKILLAFVADTLSAAPPPSGTLSGGRLSGAVTPPTLRQTLFVPAEDTLSRQPWPPSLLTTGGSPVTIPVYRPGAIVFEVPDRRATFVALARQEVFEVPDRRATFDASAGD